MASAVTHGTSWTSIDVSERQMGLRRLGTESSPDSPHCRAAGAQPRDDRAGRSLCRGRHAASGRRRAAPWPHRRSAGLALARAANRAGFGPRGSRPSELVSEVDSGVRKKSDFQRFLDDFRLVKRGFARKINAGRWTPSWDAAGKNGPLFPGRRPTKRLVLCIFFECAFDRGGSFSRPIKESV